MAVCLGSVDRIPRKIIYSRDDSGKRRQNDGHGRNQSRLSEERTYVYSQQSPEFPTMATRIRHTYSNYFINQ